MFYFRTGDYGQEINEYMESSKQPPGDPARDVANSNSIQNHVFGVPISSSGNSYEGIWVFFAKIENPDMDWVWKCFKAGVKAENRVLKLWKKSTNRVFCWNFCVFFATSPPKTLFFHFLKNTKGYQSWWGINFSKTKK